MQLGALSIEHLHQDYVWGIRFAHHFISLCSSFYLALLDLTQQNDEQSEYVPLSPLGTGESQGQRICPSCIAAYIPASPKKSGYGLIE